MFSKTKRTTLAIASPVVLFASICPKAFAVTFALQTATIADINQAFDAGAISSEQLVQLYLNRIDAYDDSGPSINAIRTLNPDALDIAAALDAERQTTGPRSPLHGIPILLKDNHDTFDIPTTGGSDALAGSIPPDDAFVVEQLRDAGAVIFGKTELDEFAISGSGYSSLGGLNLNPYQLNRQTGGSSGGTGGAIAANFATVGTGSDTGGSIRTPSSFQGLVGVRPTRGLVSIDGIIPFTPSRDMVGPMARTVTDAATTLGVMTGLDLDNPGTSTLIPPPELELDQFYTDYTQFLDPDALSGSRLGVVRNYFGEENGVDPELSQLAEAAIETMEELGATTVDLSFTEEFLTDVDITYPIAADAEQEPYLDTYLATLSPDYPQSVEAVIDILNSEAIATSDTPSIITGVLEATVAAPELAASADYVDVAENLVPMVRESLLTTFATQDLDALVFPTVDTFARPLLGTDDPTFVNPDGDPPTRPVELASATGLPDITVPAGFSRDGLPMTLSFTGRPYSESTLFGLAYAFEQETQFRQLPPTTPPLPGEVIEYQLESVPEPGTIPALTLLGLTTIGFKLRQKPTAN